MQNPTTTRRGVLLTLAALPLAACSNAVGTDGAAVIDARVAQTLRFMHDTYPASEDLSQKASGLLVTPLVTEAGLGLGGSYGRGALLVRGATVDYYAATQATMGFQAGAQQYAHVLFFMTPDALQAFRTSAGWSAGAEVEWAYSDRGLNAGADTTTVLTPVIGAVLGQSGLMAGASVEGTKYTRIVP